MMVLELAWLTGLRHENSADIQNFYDVVKVVRCELTQQLLLAQWRGLQEQRNIGQVNKEFRTTHRKKMGKTKAEIDGTWGRISKRARTILKEFNGAK